MSQIVIGAIVVALASVLAVRRIVRGQGQILRQMREWTRLKKLELSLCAPPAVREPAADERDPTEVRDEILAEIEAGPYCPVHIRPDLPPGQDTIRLHTPDGPVLVRRPVHRCHRPARRRPGARGTYRGLAALPVVGAAWRTLTALAQGTATVGGAAAASIVLSPAPMLSPAQAEQPPAVVRSVPGEDVHLQRSAAPSGRPAAPGQPLPSRSPTAADDEKASMPVPPPPSPMPSYTSTPIEPVEVAPSPTVLPTVSPSPSASPSPSPSPSASPSSPSPTERAAPETTAPAVVLTGEATA